MALSNEIDLTVEQLPQNPITLTPVDETDYNNLVGKPKVNSVILEGNKTSAQLGLASAEQGAKADSAVQPADLSVYRTAAEQDVIDNGKQDTISDLETIRSGSALGATAVQPGDLATVATSGAYSDLSGTPTIPTVDQTYDATSANAQSGVAVESAITTKADTDLSNVTDIGTSTGAGWAMPSSTYTDLTLGASGTTYTAPANGWFFIAKAATADLQYLDIEYTQSGTVIINNSKNSINTGEVVRILTPVLKGQDVNISYSLGGATSYFRFIYAEGSKSEAN